MAAWAFTAPTGQASFLLLPSIFREKTFIYPPVYHFES